MVPIAFHGGIRRRGFRILTPLGCFLRGAGWRRWAGAALSLLLVAGGGALAGCGRKLPPSPPGVNPPPAVRDLTLSLSGAVVTLSWSPVDPPEPAAVPAASYKVFRSRVPEADKDCSACPAPYLLAGELLARSRSPGSRVLFRQELQPGYHYRFKVVAFSADGAKSGDSNMVEVSL
jgi:hypothetical protein